MTINHPIQAKDENSEEEEIIWCDVFLQDDRMLEAISYCQDFKENQYPQMKIPQKLSHNTTSTQFSIDTTNCALRETIQPKKNFIKKALKMFISFGMDDVVAQTTPGDKILFVMTGRFNSRKNQKNQKIK
ncbi:hypothetical protein M0813_16214 [Anaeramoeba flamelloides]|uniref:Uncharacterized protein n=1 Tax=Anaeramoeba flamelloides TaxID=1746091 RepID=A0ABQ8YZT3_9EUKA|nr:hypothetical protein M0813_16214 [Anaeramoeba flamelloides]